MAARITKTMAFDSAPEESTDATDTTGSDQQPDNAPVSDTEPDPGDANESSEGETLSLDVFGGKEPAVGDMVTLKVTAVDPQNGTVSVMLPAAKKLGGIAGASAAMDETA